MDQEQRRDFGDDLEKWKDDYGIGHGEKLGWKIVLQLAQDWLENGTITLDPEEVGFQP